MSPRCHSQRLCKRHIANIVNAAGKDSESDLLVHLGTNDLHRKLQNFN